MTILETLREKIQDKRGDSNSTLNMKKIWRRGYDRYESCKKRPCIKLKNAKGQTGHGRCAICGRCKIYKKR